VDDLVFASAIEQAERIHRRDVSAVEALDANLEQIGRHNERLNAIITIDEDGARARAHEADAALDRGETWGPLHGVAITIKDTIETAGMRTTAGHPDLANHVPVADAPVVARLRAAGAIILGKTNTPRLATGGQTMNDLFGRTDNPWNPARTPGGSSGGASAALASGMTPLTLGGDSGGSVRIPAHFSGIFSIKPSQNRVPLSGHIPELPGRLRGMRNFNTIGPMARSIDDLTLALQIISGPDGVEWEVPPVPIEPAPERSLTSLRLALIDGWSGVRVSQSTRQAFGRLAGELEAAGATVEERAPGGFDVDRTLELCFAMFQSEMAPSRLIDLGQEPPTVIEYIEQLERRNEVARLFARFLDRYDAFLLPVTCGPAFEHCPHEAPIPIDGEDVEYWTAITAHTFPFNLTGNPAVVVPYARSEDGLPIGVQIVGRRWGEMELLAVAKAITEVTGPFQRPPGY
jgi:amidase